MASTENKLTFRDFLATVQGKRLIVLLVVIVICIFAAGRFGGDYSGYYRFMDDERIYYLDEKTWYYSEIGDGSDGWHEIDAPPAADYTNYSLGKDWSEEWGVKAFQAPDDAPN